MALAAASGRTIHTTASHRWLTTDRGWQPAGELHSGEPSVRVDGTTAMVVAIRTVPGAAGMWDLTVSNVHTFAVGMGEYVVHNCGESVWDRIAPLAEDHPGTQVPKSFMMKVGEESFHVTESATKHMAEYLTRSGSAGLRTFERATYMLEDFAGALDEAVPQLDRSVPGAQKVVAGGWEFVGRLDEMRIFHALR